MTENTDNTDETPTVSVPRTALVDHAIALARETDQYDEHLPDDAEWSWSDVQIDTARATEDGYDCHGTIDDVTVKVKTHSATRWQPASYEHIDVEAHISIHVDLTGHSGLGTASVVIEGCDPREPPEPDVHAHRHDL